MRYAKVSKEGVYSPPPPSNAKASYSTMVYVRSTIVEDAGWHLARAVTIAVSPCGLTTLSLRALQGSWLQNKSTHGFEESVMLLSSNVDQTLLLLSHMHQGWLATMLKLSPSKKLIF